MIYIATHKKVDIPHLDGYCLLQVGASGKEDFGYLRDDIGDNISARNVNFCELTGAYWIWKNSKEKYKGLVHYRRFFGKNNLSASFNQVYSYNQLVEKLARVDILLPYLEYFQSSAYNQLIRSSCTDGTFQILRKAILRLYPEYVIDFDTFFGNNRSVLFNMLFCRAELFDDYCKWLFDILFKIDEIIDVKELNDYQKRIYGFLAERLLNVWVIHNGLKVENVPVINIELPLTERMRLLRRRYTNAMRYKIIKKGEYRCI